MHWYYQELPGTNLNYKSTITLAGGPDVWITACRVDYRYIGRVNLFWIQDKNLRVNFSRKKYTIIIGKLIVTGDTHWYGVGTKGRNAILLAIIKYSCVSSILSGIICSIMNVSMKFRSFTQSLVTCNKTVERWVRGAISCHFAVERRPHVWHERQVQFIDALHQN